MTVVATRGSLRLVDDGDGMGHLEGREERRPLDSFLKWGYWKPVDLTAASGPMPGEAPLVKKYQQVLERNARRTAENYRRAMAHMVAADRPDLERVLDEATLTESQRRALKAAREKLAREAATAQAVQFGVSFAISSPYLTQLVEDHAGKQAERIVAGSREIVARVIKESFDGGWSVPQTATAIKQELSEAKKWQATMLARTDLIGLANGGSWLAAMSLGDARPAYKRWINADDERVRPTHVEAMNQIVPISKPFTVGGAPLQFPGDPSGPDEEVINCRCTLVYLDDPAQLVDHLAASLFFSTTAAGWDEEEHPRHPEGSSEGGKFAPKDTPVGQVNLGTLQKGDLFKFPGPDPGNIQWFKVKDQAGKMLTTEGEEDSVWVEEVATGQELKLGHGVWVEPLAPIQGVSGELEPIMPESAEESANSSSHRLYDVTVDGEEWLAKKVDETKEMAALRDHVEPGRDLERELAAQIVKEEIYNAAPELKLDLRVAPVEEANIAGLGHVVMSKRVQTEGEFTSHNDLSEGEARALSLYDWVIGNTDRHLGNVMRGPGGRAVAIDQGLAFPSENVDSFGRFHVLANRQDGEGLLYDARAGDLHFPDSKQFDAIGGLQEDWERIDKRLEPYLTEDERRAMWRRLEYVANGQGQFPTTEEWRQGKVDDLVRGYGWHESVTLGRDEEANPLPEGWDAEPSSTDIGPIHREEE